MMFNRDYIVAVDPSFTHFGILVYHLPTNSIVHAITLITKKESKKRKTYAADDITRRLQILSDGFNAVINKYKPYVIMAETPSGGARSASSATGLAFAKALSVIIPRMWGIPLMSIMALEAKEAATGKVGASKAAVEAAMRLKFPGAPWDDRKGHNEHQFDAAAVLTAGLNSDQIRL